MAARASVSVLVFVAEPPRVLLLRRPAARAAGWQPVSGRVEPGESREDACRREIAEETGLPPPAELLDLALEATFVGYDGATYHQRAYAARYPEAHPPVRSDEHEEARWVGLDEARAMLRWDEDRAALAALERRLPPARGEGTTARRHDDATG